MVREGAVMNQIQFIVAVQKLDMFKVIRAGHYFVEVDLIDTDFMYERSFKSGWRQKQKIRGREVYVKVPLDTVLLSLSEEQRIDLTKSLHLFANKSF
jgi:hypothetical protein